MSKRLIKPAAQAIAANRDSASYGQYRFPDDLGPHAMVLNFVEYTFDRNAEVATQTLTDSIALPIPSNLVDTFNMRVNTTELGQLGGGTAAATNSLMGSTSEEGQVTLSGLAQSSGAALEAAGLGAMLKSAAEKLDTGVIKGLEVATGKATNPHLALSFDGVDLKQHNFEWQFAPSSQSESFRLKQIINLVRKSSLPNYTVGTGRSYLDYPKAVDIFFLGSNLSYMYYFKRCLVNTFSTNYAGSGTPAFLEGGNPAVVNFNISLTEMEIHTSEDYS